MYLSKKRAEEKYLQPIQSFSLKQEIIKKEKINSTVGVSDRCLTIWSYWLHLFLTLGVY